MSVQLLRMTQSAGEAPAPRGPSPLLGKCRSGSTTEIVFEWMTARGRGRVWWTKDAIVLGTGRTPKAVDWALLFLRSVEAVEITSDVRNARYHRYRALPGFTSSLLRHDPPKA